MGRSFEEELKCIPDTIQWCLSGPIPSQLERATSALLPFPLLVVGSGGSFSAADFIARLHEQATGNISRAITPLGVFSTSVDPGRHAILFLTASGNNKDILRAVDAAIQQEFAAIAVFCAKVSSRVLQRVLHYAHVDVFEYPNPAGKDGFLAVNSLLSTCILTSRAYNAIPEKEDLYQQLMTSVPDFESPEWKTTLSRRTIVALGGGWAWPALIDLESKIAEAALNNIFISDFRNFGHGRHHWFNKKGHESALLVIETPSLALLAKKTMELLPSEFPTAILRSSSDGPLASIDLLIQIFHLVGQMGKSSGIDPGRPKIPEFGRKIYSIGLDPVVPHRKLNNRKAWINRKLRVTRLSPSLVEDCLDRFLLQLESTRFKAVVFDYDGTLCDPPERFTRPKSEIGDALHRLLRASILVGVASGRGRSVQRGLRQVIKREFWEKVIVGNYNGSLILPLSEEPPPFNQKIVSPVIREAKNRLTTDIMAEFHHLEFDTSEKQISISAAASFSIHLLIEFVMERLQGLDGLKILHSDHSVDVVDSAVSKVRMVQSIRRILDEREGQHILIMGDQGHHRGNDSEMLREPFSLSVNKISSSLSSCWNLSPAGLRGAEATVAILSAFIIDSRGFRIDTDLLQRGNK